MAIKTILLPTDFSESAQCAFTEAHDLARQLGAKLHVLHVQDGSCLRVAIREGLLDAAQTDEQLEEAVHQLIERRFEVMLAGLDPGDIVVARVSRRGESAFTIIAYAAEIGADIIVIGRR